MSKPLIYKLIKKNGRLTFKNPSDLAIFNALAEKIREGGVIDQVTFFERDDGTLVQLAIVHSMIRTLAQEIGDTEYNLKKTIKEELDMLSLDGNLKSFRDCSREELNQVKEHLIERGKWVGIDLR